MVDADYRNFLREVGLECFPDGKSMRFLLPEMAKRMAEEFAGKRCWVYVKAGNQRSARQNRYLWGVVYPYIARWFADKGSPVMIDALHEYLRAGLLSYTFVADGVEPRRVARSTTSLSVDEMAAYLDAVCAWAITHTGAAPPAPTALID